MLEELFMCDVFSFTEEDRDLDCRLKIWLRAVAQL